MAELDALLTRATSLLAQQRLDEACRDARGAMAVAEAAGEQGRIALGRALYVLGTAALLSGDPSAATAQLQRAVVLLGDDGPLRERGEAHRFLASALENLGDLRGALPHYATSAELNGRGGHARGEGSALYGAAFVQLNLGNHAEARSLSERALAVLEPLGPSSGLGGVWLAFAALAERDGEYGGALVALENARSAFDAAEFRPGEVAFLVQRAQLELSQGNHRDAERWARAALTHQDDPGHTTAQAALASALLQQGRFEDAAAVPVEPSTNPAEVLVGQMIALALAARAGDFAAVDARLTACRAVGHELLTAPHLGHATALRRAAELLTEVGELDRAAAVLAFYASCDPTWIDAVSDELLALHAAGAAIPLGPFALVRRIGKGGMGEVWLARHPTYASPLAVKVLRPADPTRTDAFRDLFDAEIRAVATLDHPGVVHVLGAGAVDPAAAVVSGVPAGSPYLVMECLSGNTLSPHAGRLDWPELRGTLLSLLDALAHAHARGVLHLDLKPANVLLDDGDGTPTLRLTDFGLAGLVNEVGDRVLGTPGYMAPEQLRGLSYALGPPSDLYALGCLAWELATGKPPFTDSDARQVRRKQLYDPPPSFVPATPVPAGLEGWLRRCLAKEPGLRYACAADAAHALASLPLAVADRPPGPTHDPSVAATIELDGPRWSTSVTTLLLGSPAPPRPEPQPSNDGAAPVIRAPVPDTWRTATPAGRAQAPFLGGPSRALFELRTPTLVGRDDACEALWGELRAVCAGGGARSIVIHGAAGVGTSRMAHWLAERADEVGAARALRVTLSRGGAGLAAFLTRECGVRDLDLPQRIDRIARWAAPETAFALAHLSLGSPGDEMALVPLVHHLATDRPAVFVLDHADEHPALIRVARRLADSSAPILVVLTAPNDVLTAHGLDEIPGIALGPLLPGHLRAVLESLLALDLDLTERLVTRARGNPRHALAMLGELVRTDALIPGHDGLRARQGAAEQLPDALVDLWIQRLDALAAPGTSLRSALELAAVLGHEVPHEVFRRACVFARCERADEARDALIRGRLASAERPGHWAFAHGMVRDALIASATAAGRLAMLHAVAADALGEDDASRAGERGEHLLAAGSPMAALEPLLVGAREAVNAGQTIRSDELLAAWERAASAAVVDADDPRRIGWNLVRGFCAAARHEDPVEYLERGLALARMHDDRPSEGKIAYALGHRRRRAGLHDEARQWFALARERGTGQTPGLALLGLAEMAFETGDPSARDLLVLAREALAGEETILLVHIELMVGRTEEHAVAVQALRRAIDLAREGGLPTREAEAWKNLARRLRLLDDTVGARRAFTAALKLYRASGSPEWREVDAELAALR